MNKYDSLIARYLQWMGISRAQWARAEAEKLELTFLAMAPKKPLNLQSFRSWLDFASPSEKDPEVERLWKRWREIFMESILDRNIRWAKLVERDGRRCRYCGSQEDAQVKLNEHHVFPSSKGGAFGISNLVVACEKCNNEILNEIRFPKSWKFGVDAYTG